MHNDEDFEGQDEWNEMRLNNQRTRYSVHIDREQGSYPAYLTTVARRWSAREKKVRGCGH
jgi:hypothetical protein